MVGGKGRKAPAQREVGRLRTHSGRGSVLGKGIGREGGGPGPAWAGEGTAGEERLAQPRIGRC